MIKAQTRRQSISGQARVLYALLFPIIITTFLLRASSLNADETGLAPSSDYRPQEVVQIVINSLQENSSARDDSGIATVFRFASPGNRAGTGPLPRFISMIKRGFPDMLNHGGARYEPMEIVNDTAVQAVWLMQDSGKEMGYAFKLSRQPAGDYAGMWMTDAVVPLGPGKGTRI